VQSQESRAVNPNESRGRKYLDPFITSLPESSRLSASCQASIATIGFTSIIVATPATR
jgi:hypothetical protein